jgi:nitrite reductase/ring-hydroxylating ferredoxin subunit
MSELRWERIASVVELTAAGGLMSAAFDRFRLALYLVDTTVYATADSCTHGGARLSEGYLQGHFIECPLHQGLFDIRTGEVAGPPCKRPVRVFPVRTQGDEIIVGFRLPRAEESPAAKPGDG